MNKNNEPVVLTIAGLDPSGGAGVIADIRTFVAFNCFPTAAVTSITFQNTTGVFGAVHQTAATVLAQLQPIVDDYTVAAIKTGMLPNAEIVNEVARFIREAKLPLPVVDPVMVSTSGHDLIDEDAFKTLVEELLPLARIVTPNIPEAQRLAKFSIDNVKDMKRAARVIQDSGPEAVLVKGGHLGRDSRGDAVDVLLTKSGEFVEFRNGFVDVGPVHGSGCTLSASIAACLASGMDLEQAVGSAKDFVTAAILALRTRPRLGHGARPI